MFSDDEILAAQELWVREAQAELERRRRAWDAALEALQQTEREGGRYRQGSHLTALWGGHPAREGRLAVHHHFAHREGAKLGYTIAYLNLLARREREEPLFAAVRRARLRYKTLQDELLERQDELIERLQKRHDELKQRLAYLQAVVDHPRAR